MGKTRVVLDTNILVSGLGWKGKPYEILRLVIDGEVELFISRLQFDEISRVLDYPKFDFAQGQKEEFKTLLSAIATLLETTSRVNLIKDDPQDNVLLECAVEAKADFVVSGDKHLLAVKKFEGIVVTTASDFLRENLSNKRGIRRSSE